MIKKDTTTISKRVAKYFIRLLLEYYFPNINNVNKLKIGKLNKVFLGDRVKSKVSFISFLTSDPVGFDFLT